MGLDHYLTGKQFFSTYEYDPKDVEMQKHLGEVLRNYNHGFKVKYVEYEIITWRKANYIHNWFVQNVQGGIDDCGLYRVTGEKLKELAHICEQVLLTNAFQRSKNFDDYTVPVSTPLRQIRTISKKPKELLPPVEGFFFGTTKIDDHYFDEVKRTAETLREIIPLDHFDTINGLEFYYSSSW